MSNGWILGLAEKPKVEELQMDWLRSEDLKEEQKVTSSMVIIAVGVLLVCVVGKKRSRSGQCIMKERPAYRRLKSWIPENVTSVRSASRIARR